MGFPLFFLHFCLLTFGKKPCIIKVFRSIDSLNEKSIKTRIETSVYFCISVYFCTFALNEKSIKTRIATIATPRKIRRHFWALNE